jgi:uncharacterized membrane protein
MPQTERDLAEPTSMGIAANVGGALTYVLGPITGIAFYLLEKDNRFVRYHAAQSITVGVVLIALSIALSILSTVLAFVPVLGWIVALLLSLGVGVAAFVLWLMLMWKAYNGAEWETPVAGPLARKLVPRLPVVTTPVGR